MTCTLSSILAPSLTLRSGLRPATKEGGHMRESSGGRASSLVAEREREPPDAVESVRLHERGKEINAKRNREKVDKPQDILY